MKKISTATAQQSRNFSQQKLTIGLDLGDRSSWYCVLDEGGEVVLEQRLGTTPKAMKEVFGACRAAGSLWKRECIRRGEPVVKRVGTRSDRGACAQRPSDRGEPKERRSTAISRQSSMHVGMLSSRYRYRARTTSARFLLNFITIRLSTLTGSPLTTYGLNCHCLMARVATSARTGSPEIRDVLFSVPS
jgi:hypothetical protein